MFSLQITIMKTKTFQEAIFFHKFTKQPFSGTLQFSDGT